MELFRQTNPVFSYVSTAVSKSFPYGVMSELSIMNRPLIQVTSFALLNYRAVVVALKSIFHIQRLDLREHVIQTRPIAISIHHASTHEVLDSRRKSLRHPLRPVLIQHLPTFQLLEASNIPRLQVFEIIVLSLEFGTWAVLINIYAAGVFGVRCLPEVLSARSMNSFQVR